MKKEKHTYQHSNGIGDKYKTDSVSKESRRPYTRLEKILDSRTKIVERDIERFRFLLHRYAF